MSIKQVTVTECESCGREQVNMSEGLHADWLIVRVTHTGSSGGAFVYHYCPDCREAGYAWLRQHPVKS